MFRKTFIAESECETCQMVRSVCQGDAGGGGGGGDAGGGGGGGVMDGTEY